MPPSNLTPEQAALIKRVTEIGMAYLIMPGEAHKQYGLEAVLTLLTGSCSVEDFRHRYNPEGKQWPHGKPA